MSAGELDMSSPVSHVAAELEGAGPSGPAPTLEAMATSYRHPVASDLARIRKHEGAADDDAAVMWLIQAAVSELGTQVRRDGEGYQLTKPFDELRWGGRPVHRPGRDAHARLGDPFNPMAGGIFATNIRIGRNAGRPPAEDAALRDSMRENGWLPGHPAIKDERGVTLSGHRRLRFAAELRAEGHEIPDDVLVITFGSGDGADIERVRHAWWSNEGARPYTPSDREAMAVYLRERGWTQDGIAGMLRVAQKTISEDLKRAEQANLIIPGYNQDAPQSPGHGGRRRGSGRPRGTGNARHGHAVSLTDEWQAYIREHFHEFGGDMTVDQLVAATGGRSRDPVRMVINLERGRRQALAAANAAPVISPPSTPAEAPMGDQPSWKLVIELFSRLDADDKALFLKEIGAVIQP